VVNDAQNDFHAILSELNMDIIGVNILICNKLL